ncbi:DUF6608 family protein [Salisediminibacterium beveridgei]|uniref:DUF6608 family protein n=1 Tax=Salisediminibacterium beveridgei TaxID=632773 RepID=UPI0018DD1650|nr:DUF6608 family protein [Salisediminibacterium beveridgei]
MKNALILICIVYTLLTVLSSSYALMVGVTSDTHFHLLARFMVTAVGIGSILLFNLFPEWKLWKRFVMHYTVTMGLIWGLVWFSGFFTELHPNAYRDIFLNFTPVYLLIAAGFLIREHFKNRKITA